MADMAKQVLSRVCGFMVSDGALSVNPCEGISNLYSTDRSDIIWTTADLEALCKAASPEIAWAAQLAAQTGLRQGDLLRLPWSRISDLAIETKTAKSGGRRRVVIPISSELRDLLKQIPRRAITVLTNTHGEPWKTGFGASWAAAVARAGLGERGLSTISGAPRPPTSIAPA
jgi:integrase